MVDYRNGELPASLLRPVSNFRPLTSNVNAAAGSNLLREDAWSALNLLQVAFFQRFGRSLDISEAYRKRALQDYYWDLYIRGIGNLAAKPGTSNHGWGVSCDFGSGASVYGSPTKVWLDANAPRFGWHPTGNSFVRREGWHFDYVPGTATEAIPSFAGSTPSPFPSTAPDQEEEPDMSLLERFKVNGDPTGTVYLAENRMSYRPIAGDESDAIVDMLRRLNQSEVVLTTSTPGIFGVDLSKKNISRELAKQRGGDGTIWYSVDRLTRIPVPADRLPDYVYYLGKLGYSTTVQEVAAIGAFGQAI